MGKILDALKGKTNAQSTSPSDVQENDGPMDFRFLKPLAFGLAIVLFIAVVAFAAYSVLELFGTRLGATPIEAALATLASVGVCVGVLFIVLTSTHHPLRGLGAIVLIAWSFLVLALVALNSALRGGLLTVPEALTSIGRLVAALLAGAALVPALTLPIAAHDKGKYDSAAAAASKYLGFIAKGVGVAVSAAASVYFGLGRGINPFVAGLAGFVLESCFLWSYLMLIRAMKARDAFDVNLWRIATVAFGLFLAAVSIETISTIAQIDVPIVSALGEVGATLYVSAVGLSLILTIAAHVITSKVNIPMDGAPATPARIVKPSLAHRAGMVAARPSILADEFRRGRAAALGKPAEGAPALPAGTALASEGADDGWTVETFSDPTRSLWSKQVGDKMLRVYDWPEIHWTVSRKGQSEFDARDMADSVEAAKVAALAAAREHKADAVKGRDYDTTGEIVLKPEDDTALREAFWRQTRSGQGGASGGDGTKK